MRLNKNKLICKLFRMKEVTLGDVVFYFFIVGSSGFAAIEFAQMYRVLKFIAFSYPFEITILLSSLVTGMCAFIWIAEGLFSYKIAECPLK
jgi:hypothetical protein